MNDLERSLSELDVQWPATPDLAAAVRTRLAPAPARRRAPRWGARLAYVAAALAIVIGSTLAVSPEARSTVLRWLGLESVEIERGNPTATPVPPSPVGRTLGLGRQVTLEQARRSGLPMNLPASLGDPDAVYVTSLPGSARAVSLVYAPRAGIPASGVSGAGLLVQTFRASATPFIEKTAGTGGDVHRLSVDGAPAYWISNAHGFAYESPDGFGYEEQRLADRTLLVEHDGLLTRVEGAISRERAVEIARDAIRADG